MEDACIVGYGVVGRATAAVFGIQKYFDLQGSTITLQQAARCRLIFLCLPTPTIDNDYDIRAIRDTLKQIAGYGCGGIIINRSTVLPGTARHLSAEFNVPLVANPEFLSEATADYDAKHPDFIVIGADIPVYGEAVRNLYESRHKGVDIIQTDTLTAELIKVTMNAFYATKVVFANQIFDYCDRLSGNYLTVKKALEKSRYGSKNHFDVWHNNGRGAGGKCLKKDLDAFAYNSKSELLQTVQRLNQGLLDKYPKHG